MLKFNALSTAIRIKKKTVTTNENGFPVETWADILNEDIPCEWRNKFGRETYQAAMVNALEPASVKLWYIPGIDPSCQVIRVEDNAIFEIVGIDDVSNRHQQLEIEIKRYVAG